MIDFIKKAAEVRKAMVALPQSIEAIDEQMDATDAILEQIKLSLDGEARWFGADAACECRSKKDESG